MSWEIIQSAIGCGYCHLHKNMIGDPSRWKPSCTWERKDATISVILSFYQDRQIRTHRVPLLHGTSFKVRLSPWVTFSLAVRHSYVIYSFRQMLFQTRNIKKKKKAKDNLPSELNITQVRNISSISFNLSLNTPSEAILYVYE